MHRPGGGPIRYRFAETSTARMFLRSLANMLKTHCRKPGKRALLRLANRGSCPKRAKGHIVCWVSTSSVFLLRSLSSFIGPRQMTKSRWEAKPREFCECRSRKSPIQSPTPLPAHLLQFPVPPRVPDHRRDSHIQTRYRGHSGQLTDKSAGVILGFVAVASFGVRLR